MEKNRFLSVSLRRLHCNICSNQILTILALSAQLAFTCSTLTTETLEQGVKYVQN